MVAPVPFLRLLLRLAVHRTVVVASAVLLTFAAFLVLPVMATLGKPEAPDLVLQTVDTADVPPPPAPPDPEPPPQRETEQEPPQLAERAEPLDLQQLELALNPGTSAGWLGGDLAVGKLPTAAAAAEDAEALFSSSELDQPPRPVHQPSPMLTPELRRKAPATVHVLFLVSTDGRVENAIVHKSTDAAFDQPALAAVRQWKFEPGKRGGKPVRFRMLQPFVFPKG